MSENYEIKSLTKQLNTELISNEGNKLSEELEARFYKLMELITLSMLEGDDNFFGSVLIQMKREINYDINSPLLSLPQGRSFVLYMNPKLFLECSYVEMKALIKHEIYHIISKHHIRAKAMKKTMGQLAINLAMDISVNQYLINLPSWSETMEKVNQAFDLELNDSQTMEQQAEVIQAALKRLRSAKSSKDQWKFAQELIGEGKDSAASHDYWESVEEKIDPGQIEESLKKLTVNAAKGKVPDSVNEIIAKLYTKPVIKWSDFLKRLVGTTAYGHKKTVTRQDRRQPWRSDLRGSLVDHKAEIIVAIDISGSMTDTELEQIMNEIFGIVRTSEHEITIIECDDKIQRVYNAKTNKDVRKKTNTKGSTKFSPVFRFMRENNKRNAILVYFTDGEGERELEVLPFNRRTLWVLTGKSEKLSLKDSFGNVIKLSIQRNDSTQNSYEIVRNEMKDRLVETPAAAI